MKFKTIFNTTLLLLLSISAFAQPSNETLKSKVHAYYKDPSK
ncbi:MAG: hypothetical protein ACI857_001963, partial [Arenicella sp.]